MNVIGGMNMDEVSYFDIFEYIARIELNSSILSHAEETSQEFNSFMQELFQYDAYSVASYLVDSFRREMVDSQKIEKHYINMNDIKEYFFFDTFNISHAHIHKMHQICTMKDNNNQTGYRTVPVRVSTVTPQGEFLFWKAPNPELVELFMDDFIKAYKRMESSVLFSNPFLVSALMHLLFVRIHPYNDGNGRTARLIHNIKFTESINKIYNTNFKLAPLNLSGSILINKPTYADRMNAIYFDLVHDTNEAINRWFDFILNMGDEQIYYNKNRLRQRRTYIEALSNRDRIDLGKQFVKTGRM